MFTITWQEICHIQEQLYPDWRTKKPRLLYSTALAGELGELCGVITHLDGGGTNLQKYTEAMILEEAADTYIQLVLLLERSGFGMTEFLSAVDDKLKHIRTVRMKARRR
jgi:NTP pyrophosphatase (non-canonical NTP hydrolase)